MAYPTGSGSERIRTGAIHPQVADATAFKWDGTNPTVGDETYAVPTNHIITVLTISICEMSNATRTFQLLVSSGGVNINILYNTSVGTNQTYIWNNKMILHPADKLIIQGEASSSFTIQYTYIDQNWE